MYEKIFNSVENLTVFSSLKEHSIKGNYIKRLLTIYTISTAIDIMMAHTQKKKLFKNGENMTYGFN